MTTDDWPFELLGLYETQYGDLVRLAYLLCGVRETAEDAVQEAFISVAGRWAAINDSHGGYLRQCVVNAVFQRQRHHRRQSARLASLAQGGDDSVVDFDPGEFLDLLSALSWPQRVAIVASYWLDLPDTEIAQLLDCRLATVRSHRARALDALRSDLEVSK